MKNWNKVTEYLEGLSESYGVPGGEMQVYQEGELIYAHRFGDRAGTEKNLYWLYSMSKVYTAAAAMQLVEQGKLSLEQKVTEFFPRLREIKKADKNGKEISLENLTVRNLLSMTGGLNYEINGPRLSALRAVGEAAIEQIVQAIYEDALEYEPGEHYRYSLCHDIVGAIIWKITGLTLDQYEKTYLFDPLGIVDMGFYPSEEQKERIADQYRQEESGIELVSGENQLVIEKNFASGGAGLFGNLADYMKLPNALAQMGKMKNGVQILKPETIDLLRQDQLTEERLFREFHAGFQNHGLEGFSYALGVRTRIADMGNSPVGEFGWDGAAGGFVLIDPKNSLTVGYLQHVLNFGKAYAEIHPRLRELVYEIMSKEERG